MEPIRHFVTTVPSIGQLVYTPSKEVSVVGSFSVKKDVLDLSTTCGLHIGGMKLNQLTVVPDLVTCTACTTASRFPLDILNRTEL